MFTVNRVQVLPRLGRATDQPVHQCSAQTFQTIYGVLQSWQKTTTGKHDGAGEIHFHFLSSILCIVFNFRILTVTVITSCQLSPSLVRGGPPDGTTPRTCPRGTPSLAPARLGAASTRSFPQSGSPGCDTGEGTLSDASARGIRCQ